MSPLASQRELQKRSGVGLSTIKDFESGTRKTIQANLRALQAALEAGGLRFTSDPEGVLRADSGAEKTKGSR